MENSTIDLRDGEEIKPYKIHVSSKYLDLTKKKLELTRLPHELLAPRAREWEYGTPKSEIEPLVDYWLEHYSWRTRETNLNNLPQFRTAISIPSNPHPLRIHFLHIRSPHTHAIPLLLIPSFPLPNLSPLLTPLFKPLTEPESPTSSQPFHLVIPSIPGLGFSDAFQSDEKLLEGTAELFNTLMQRLGYENYLASSTGSGRASPAGIDYHLTRLVGEKFSDACMGVHLIEPLVERPKVGTWEWTKFTFAKFFHANVFGYTAGDFHALREGEKAVHLSAQSRRLSRATESTPLLAKITGPCRGFGAVGTLGLREPNTLAYALCDSPVGLLSLVCSALRKTSPGHTLSSEDIIDVTQMAWLPGPEAGMRLWSSVVDEVKSFESSKVTKKTRVAVTVFGVAGVGAEEGEGYVCPAWSRKRHDVLFVQRVKGQPGLAAFQRTDVLEEGIRGLAKGVDAVDGRLRVSALESVIVGAGEETIPEEGEDVNLVQWDVESPDTVVGVQVS